MSLAFVAADASREQNTALDHVYSKFLYTEDQIPRLPRAQMCPGRKLFLSRNLLTCLNSTD